MKLPMVLAAIAALALAETSYGECGCTSAIGPPAVSCSTPCCPDRCCRLFPTLPQIFRGFGRLVDCLLPCHGCGPRFVGPLRGGCCHSPMLPACRPRPCAACLWPSLHCCTYRNAGCGGHTCGIGGGDFEYDYSTPTHHHHQQPHPAAPAIPEDLDDVDPFQDDMPMMMQQTRTAPRRSNSVGLNAPQRPMVASRPIERTSLNQPTNMPTMQPARSMSGATPYSSRMPKPAAKPIDKSTSTRINSRITPASHEIELAEPAPISEVSSKTTPLRQISPSVKDSSLPANPLR